MARKPTINTLHTRRLAAVDVFSKAANELLVIGTGYRELADQAYAEAAEREDLAADAARNSNDAFEQARKIRELLG